MKILIADDSPSERALLAQTLEGLGCEIILAEDGEEAERRFYEERPALMILDVIMPKRNGYQVCRAIKGRAEFLHTPIIMVSARTQESDRYWGLKQGADDYLSKPFELSLLREKVRSFLPQEGKQPFAVFPG